MLVSSNTQHFLSKSLKNLLTIADTILPSLNQPSNPTLPTTTDSDSQYEYKNENIQDKERF